MCRFYLLLCLFSNQFNGRKKRIQDPVVRIDKYNFLNCQYLFTCLVIRAKSGVFIRPFETCYGAVSLFVGLWTVSCLSFNLIHKNIKTAQLDTLWLKDDPY